MLPRATTLLVAWFAVAPPGGQRQPPHTFDADRPGVLPDGFTLGAMRQGSPGTWLIARDGSDGYLLHRADPSAAGLALAIAPDAALRDLVTSVRLRLVGGGRAGGLVWRYRDASNFHAALLDLSKGALVLFRVIAGNRTSLESEDNLELDAAVWHTLKVVHEDDEIDVVLDGIPVFRERERRYDRQNGSGRTGVIATGNSEVWFDSLRIEPNKK
jgi:hypothetical protein